MLDQPGTKTKVFVPVTKHSAKRSTTRKLKCNGTVTVALKKNLFLTKPEIKNKVKMHTVWERVDLLEQGREGRNVSKVIS